MQHTKLSFNQITEAKTIFRKAFYPKGFDILINGPDHPQFRLYFSNNKTELENVVKGKESEMTPFFLDFKVDPYTNGSYFIPESKKRIPKFDYCILLSNRTVEVEIVDFFYEYLN